jgi:hypothetical protein
MWFILLFAASGLALQIAFEVAKSGSDNILRRSGEEIRNSRLASHFSRFTKTASDGVLATVSLFSAVLVLGVLWKLLRMLLNLF